MERVHALSRHLTAASSPQPFHLAIPVHDLAKAKQFYSGVLHLEEGRSASSWQDYNFFGHQLVVHCVHADYRAPDLFNPVDKDDVPVPHFGVCLTVEQFEAFAKAIRGKVKFVIEPHLRFPGQPGEQWTMFFKDPSNNSLEFKAMTNPDNLFAKYNVDEV